MGPRKLILPVSLGKYFRNSWQVILERAIWLISIWREGWNLGQSVETGSAGSPLTGIPENLS